MNQIVEVKPQGFDKAAYKARWQREARRKFATEHGFSSAANYATGKRRLAVLQRDGHACVKCGMTSEDHMAKWGRPITVDHKSKDRSDNSMGNLQTLCLSCHGRKDLIPQLRQPKVAPFKEQILRMRAEGKTFAHISDALGFSRGTLCTWCKTWATESKGSK